MAKTKTKRKLPLKDFGRYLLSALILAQAFGLAAWMYVSKSDPEEAGLDDAIQKVSVAAVQPFDGQLELNVSGIVEAHREIEIAAQVSGEITFKDERCRAGNYVPANTVLLKIDSTNYDFALARAQAEKQQAEASIEELKLEIEGIKASMRLAENEFKMAKTEYDRKLRAGSALSESERDQSERSVNTADRQLTDLRNNMLLAEKRRLRLDSSVQLSSVRLEEAQQNIDRCQIVTKFAGVIVSDPVENGDYVAAGTQVVVFEDTEKVDVRCNLRFEQLQQIVKYQVPDSRFTTDPTMAYQIPPTAVDVVREVNGQQTKWPGTLDRFDGIGVDSQTKMIPCRIVVDKPVSLGAGTPQALVRGMFVRVQIPLNTFESENETLLQVPAIAVRPGRESLAELKGQNRAAESGMFVWTVRDNKLRRHRVTVLDRKNDDDPNPRNRSVIIKVPRNEISKDDQVVTSPLAQPIPGSEVETVSPSATNKTMTSDTNEANNIEATTDSNQSGSGSDQEGVNRS